VSSTYVLVGGCGSVTGAPLDSLAIEADATPVRACGDVRRAA